MPADHRLRRRTGRAGPDVGRARLAGRRRPVPATAAHHHRHRPGHLRDQPAPPARPDRASGDEFAELAGTLDDLFARLEAAFASQRHFVANASHELRTPLTAERTLLQVALADPSATADTLRSACQDVLALGEAQERLIEALLTLASGEQGVEQREPLGPRGLCTAALRRRSADGEGPRACE